uniref:Uncharacterized protein n=1 Tax=Brassica campestris TaxID=3711 RepID=A0A3P6BN86_BRACM|nr:unnamed protein product [Brassica rapa]
MNDHKSLLQGGMEEENPARKPSQLRLQVAFNVCCLCVYCPLCILWCCIKLPFFWRAILKTARPLHGCSGCGRSLSMRIKDADYSSFLDIDLDEVEYKKLIVA